MVGVQGTVLQGAQMQEMGDGGGVDAVVRKTLQGVGDLGVGVIGTAIGVGTPTRRWIGGGAWGRARRGKRRNRG